MSALFLFTGKFSGLLWPRNLKRKAVLLGDITQRHTILLPLYCGLAVSHAFRHIGIHR
ncbi:hypothetical protein EV690_0102 [Celerinatantimonas diazotrophica]|uniref:Uncharacterized protein n=1 Tax=Celerinatantimonas diazotrophica TaxID=412034 RepID=A0A4R1KGU9_9GAMM|nr:hypothetical protein EV690_0102 [Celerinatantimonas diazotrophica]CAG9297073.1 hypothetical protein CEDIAZO_02235 [Celerinatantimonas diazotrophica]